VPFLLWLAGALAVSGVFLSSAAKLRGLTRRAGALTAESWAGLAGSLARERGVRRGAFRLLRSAEAHPPTTWGLFRPVVLMPANCDEWSVRERRDVLLHELSHLTRRDCLTQLLANLTCAVHWFNPLVWVAARRMLAERERACDDQVLLSGAKPSDYAESLLKIARSLGADAGTAKVGVAMARRGQISGRLLAILDPGLRRGAPRLVQTAGSAVMLLAVLGPLAALGPAPGASPRPATGIAADEVDSADFDGLSDVRQAIDEANEQIEQAFRQGDIGGITRLYTADARILAPKEPDLRGRRDIARLHASILAVGFERLDITTLEVSRVGNLALEIGTFSYRHEEGTGSMKGRYMALWQWDGERWRIHRAISNH
jgi:ketosteroid isomerase-like protein